MSLDFALGLGVFHMAPESTLRDVGEHISRLGADRFREVEGFAYVFPHEISAAPSEVSGVRHYERFRPIYIVDRTDNELRIRRLEDGQMSLAMPPEILSKVREADFLALMSAGGSACIMEPGGNYHFVTPALMHTNRFLRIGDLIRDRETLDRLVFWIEGVLVGCQGLLIDSWTIASLGLRAMQKRGVDIPFDCLPEHPSHNREACRAVIENLLNTAPRGGKLLVLVSISGSGSLVKQIQGAVREIAGEEVKVECLSLYGFRTTPEEIECIARIDDKEGTYPESACKLCAEGSSAIPLDPSSYHLRSWREVRVMTGERHFRPGRDFLEDYRDVDGLFFVHRDDQSDRRHHAFDIDVLRLLRVPAFRDRLIKKLEEYRGRKDLIVCPSHRAADELRALAEEVLGIPSIVHDTLDGHAVGEDARLQISRSRDLLIIDDTINSGTRLSRYIQSLREGGYNGFDTIDCLVALARPEAVVELDQASKSISNRHDWSGQLDCVEMLLLPRWSENECPWCKEFDYLSRVEELFSRPPDWLVARNQKLGGRGKGISDEPFLLLPGVVAPVLGDESVIAGGGLPGTQTVFGVASALQRHRKDSDQWRQLHPDYPLANVIDPKIFSERFTEGMIRAALVRCATRNEFGNQACIESRDFLLLEMPKENQRIMAGELLLALGRRSFPPISAEAFTSAFGGFMATHELELMARVMELPQPR